MLPLKFVITPRWFHKVNVAVVRFINFPILLIISLIERRTLWRSSRHRATRLSHLDRQLAYWNFSRFSVHGDIQAVFDTPPPRSVLEEIEAVDDFSHGGGHGDLGTSPGRHHSRKIPSAYDHHQHHQSNNSNSNHQQENDQPHNNDNNNEEGAGGGDPSTSYRPQPSIHFDDDLLAQTHNRRFSTTSTNDGANDDPSPSQGYRRPNRKDSLLGLIGSSGLSDAGIVEVTDMVQENNEKLEKLERVVRRIEGLLGRCLDEGIIKTGREESVSAGSMEDDVGEIEGEGDDDDGDGSGDGDGEGEGADMSSQMEGMGGKNAKK